MTRTTAIGRSRRRCFLLLLLSRAFSAVLAARVCARRARPGGSVAFTNRLDSITVQDSIRTFAIPQCTNVHSPQNRGSTRLTLQFGVVSVVR